MWHLCEKEVAGTNASSDVADRMKRDWFLWWDRKKRVMLDKSVVNTARIQWLNRHFRPAYFVGIIRNGFAACEGIRRRASESHRLDRKRFPNGYSMELCARQWRRSIECLEEAASMVRDFYLLRYEDLVADTDQVVTRLVEWLPVGKEFALNEDYVFTFHRETNRIRDFNKAAIEKITEQDRAAVMQEAREKMEQYGYA